MGIIATENSSPRELLPTGNVQGVCYGVAEIGRRDGMYGIKHEAVVLFEIPSLRGEDDDGRDMPRKINKFYHITVHADSNLGKDLTSWRGKPFTEKEKEGFDITSIIGVNCLLNIAHYEKKDKSTGDKVASITPLMAGMAKLEPEHTVVNYSIADHGFNFDGVPEWVVKEIKKSEEYKAKDDVREDSEPAPEDTTDYSDQTATEDPLPF
jgi:hypothetical protein